MGLDLLRKRPRDAVSPRAAVDLMERDLPPLPSFDEEETQPVDLERADAELAEFVEFFTGSHRIVTPSAVQPITPLPPLDMPRSRLRRATERVVRVAAMRPVVRMPMGKRAQVFDMAIAEVEDDEAAETPPMRRAIKLPPIWVITNLAILLALVVGFFPQIMTASAAAGCKWYRVRPGDTLSKISHHYGVKISQLASANHIENINLIYVDQNMCIPMTSFAASNQPANAPSSHPPIYGAPANVRAFINYTLPYARRASQATGWPVSVILAQWGLETGWRVRTYTGFNWGNCGAMPGQPTVGGINVPGSPAAFAYAYTPNQGLAEYIHVAHLGYYTSVARAAHNGANAAARALGQSPWDWGHYTSSHNPGSSIISIMRAYNLYYYDTH